MTIITRDEAKQLLIARRSGAIMTVTFVKRTNDEIRVLNCRKGVKKDQTGEGLKFNPIQRNLLPVFDMKKGAYRFVNLETIKSIKADKREYEIKE